MASIVDKLNELKGNNWRSRLHRRVIQTRQNDPFTSMQLVAPKGIHNPLINLGFNDSQIQSWYNNWNNAKVYDLLKNGGYSKLADECKGQWVMTTTGRHTLFDSITVHSAYFRGSNEISEVSDGQQRQALDYWWSKDKGKKYDVVIARIKEWRTKYDPYLQQGLWLKVMREFHRYTVEIGDPYNPFSERWAGSKCSIQWTNK